MKDGRCTCDEFEGAQKFGTDGEGYGAAVFQNGGEYLIGSYLHPLSFCPWCGHELPVGPGDSPDEQPGAGP